MEKRRSASTGLGGSGNRAISRDMARVSRSIEVDVTPDVFHKVVQTTPAIPNSSGSEGCARRNAAGQRRGSHLLAGREARVFDFTLRMSRARSNGSNGPWSGGEFMRANEGLDDRAHPERGTARPMRSRSIWADVSGRSRSTGGAGPANMLTNFKTRAETIRETTR